MLKAQFHYPSLNVNVDYRGFNSDAQHRIREDGESFSALVDQICVCLNNLCKRLYSMFLLFSAISTGHLVNFNHGNFFNFWMFGAFSCNSTVSASDN